MTLLMSGNKVHYKSQLFKFTRTTFIMLCIDPALTYAFLHGELPVDVCQYLKNFLERHLIAYTHSTGIGITANIIDLVTRREECSISNQHSSISSVAMHYPYLFLATIKGSVSVMHLITHATLLQFLAPMHSVTQLQCVARINSYILLGSGYGLNVFVWNIQPTRGIWDLQNMLYHHDIVEHMAAGNLHVATTAHDPYIHVWNIDQGRVLLKINVMFCSSLTMAPSGWYLSGIVGRNRWCVWNISTGCCVAEQPVLDDKMRLHFHPTQQRVLGIQKNLVFGTTTLYDWGTTCLLKTCLADNWSTLSVAPRILTVPEIICDAVWLQKGNQAKIACRYKDEIYCVL
jgi:hypothetical protein